MASVNKVILIGSLGRDPDVRYLPSGDAVANVTLATNSKYKNKAGETIEEVEWHRISFWGKLAEIVGQYLKKGASVYVEGAIKTRKYTYKDGVEKFSTEIKADTMKMLGGKPEGQESRPAQAPRQAPQASQRAVASPSGFDDMDDDIPF